AYREQASWQHLTLFDRYLRTTPEKQRFLLVESRGTPDDFVSRQGSTSDYERFKEWTRERFVNSGIGPSNQKDLTPLRTVFAMDEMAFLKYLVAHDVDVASIHRAVETHDLSQLRFFSKDHISMQAWDPSNDEIVRHLQNKGFNPLHIVLEQMSKHVINIIQSLTPGEQQLPTGRLFEALLNTCNATGWQKEQVSARLHERG